MATSKWLYSENVFKNVTKDNFIKMRIIAIYTKAVLTARQTDTGIAAILLIYAAICDAYIALYNTWIESGGEHIGSTSEVKGLFKNLSSKLARQWDIAIQMVYDIDSDDYKRLLPNRRKPFQTKKQADRQAAVSALIEAIGSDASLATLKAQIVAFSYTLDASILAHQGDMGSTEVLSDNLEHQRIGTAEGLVQVYASLMLLNLTDLKRIEPFFDLENIRQKRQTVFVEHVSAGSFKFIFIRTFKPTDTFTVENTGDANLDFGVSQTRTQPFSSPPFLSVSGHSNSTGNGTQIINGSFRFFMVVNNSGQDGSFKLTTNF